MIAERRPQLAFRIGVTGARDLGSRPDAVQIRIREQVTGLLRMVGETVATLARHRDAQATYGADPRPRLRLLSPLAEGADRLVAEIAVGLGYEIGIALPFARADYARDFTDPASAAAFERWLGPEDAPEIRPYLALDGGRGEHETASYEAVGRLVVRNCDLLIAVWDGRPARGRGGTAEIVRFGVGWALPVWWIDATGVEPPRLLRKAADLRAPEDVPRDEEAAQILGRLIGGMLLPHPHRRHGHGPIELAMDRLLGPGADPLDIYLHGRPLPKNPLWDVYGLAFRALGGRRLVPAPEPVPVPDGPTAYWEALYRTADRASTDYAKRYRSSYVWILLLSTLAVTCAGTALVHAPWRLAAASGEIVALVLILALVAVNGRRAWHGCWIACRLLAELCRAQGALAALGWSLPAAELRRSLHADGPRDGGYGEAHRPAEPGPPEAWVGPYFEAMLRAAPLPRGDLTGRRLTAVRDYVRGALVEDRRRYHADRRTRGRRAGLRLVRFGELAFLATLALVLVTCALLVAFGQAWTGGHGAAAESDLAHALLVVLGPLATVLPAVSAAFFGIRACAAPDLLERQSDRVLRLMSAAGGRIDRLDLSRPLASQALAAEVMEVSAALLQELGGWAGLSRVRAAKAG